MRRFRAQTGKGHHRNRHRRDIRRSLCGTATCAAGPRRRSNRPRASRSLRRRNPNRVGTARESTGSNPRLGWPPCMCRSRLRHSRWKRGTGRSCRVLRCNGSPGSRCRPRHRARGCSSRSRAGTPPGTRDESAERGRLRVPQRIRRASRFRPLRWASGLPRPRSGRFDPHTPRAPVPPRPSWPRVPLDCASSWRGSEHESSPERSAILPRAPTPSLCHIERDATSWLRDPSQVAQEGDEVGALRRPELEALSNAAVRRVGSNSASSVGIEAS
jgi:hypothetical protein